MILENLKNFEWYNEPANVTFGSHELEITAAEGTDFWQSKHHNFFKDDGHFFFITQRISVAWLNGGLKMPFILINAG